MCVSLSLQRYSFLFQKLENDKLMTAAFLKSRNVFPGSFFRIRPMENKWGQEPGRQMCSLQTASLSHKLHKEEGWQLIGTNEPRIIISFKQIPFGLKFAVQKPICYLLVHLHLFIHIRAGRLRVKSNNPPGHRFCSRQKMYMQGEVANHYVP